MRSSKTSMQRKGGGNGLVAVAISKDKGSQNALKWACDNILSRGQTVILIHVLKSSGPLSERSANGTNSPRRTTQLEKITKDLFLTFHCFCTRKDIQCLDIILEDTDVVKALTEYISHASIENLVLGTSARHGFIRFKTTSIPSSISKGVPDFCTVYIISKGKISSVRNATRQATYTSPLLDQIENLGKRNDPPEMQPKKTMNLRDRSSFRPRNINDDYEKSPFSRVGKPHGELSEFNGDISFVSAGRPDTDISFVSSGRPSTDRSSLLFDSTDSARTSHVSAASYLSFGSIPLGHKMFDGSSHYEFSSVSHESSERSSLSSSSQTSDDVESEMRRLKLELKQTMDMYSAACKEALTARQKAKELQQWRLEEEQKLEESRVAEETALSMADNERARYTSAVETAEASTRLANMEAQMRQTAESNSLKDSEDGRRVRNIVPRNDLRYRRYSIEEIETATEFFSDSRKIGEGGYGPVYKCRLDHTPVAVKVLRPDAAQGRSQFNQEIEVLSSIRHPNMVLLLGACPEYGCIVYEYMAKGSLEDCLFRKKNTPALSWQLRFRIAAEIATCLLFLHQSKPEPLVHRDLKPGNILLDNNYVSKIGDVGLAKLVPAVAENVTQCHVTAAAGTFCYIDPEYQQTGVLGVKSDVYSLGILLLQLITAKPAMGLAHNIERCIENETLFDMLDPAVPDWPREEVLSFAELSLRCAELRRKDRPDLGKEILPELSRLRDFAEDNMTHLLLGVGAGVSPYASPYQSHIYTSQGAMSSQSNPSSLTGKANGIN